MTNGGLADNTMISIVNSNSNKGTSGESVKYIIISTYSQFRLRAGHINANKLRKFLAKREREREREREV